MLSARWCSAQGADGGEKGQTPRRRKGRRTALTLWELGTGQGSDPTHPTPGRGLAGLQGEVLTV